jgi:hypothetical protein
VIGPSEVQDELSSLMFRLGDLQFRILLLQNVWIDDSCLVA